MTLKNSQVESLYSYILAEYQNKLRKMEALRIKEIEESEEYKTKLEKITNFLTNINYPLNRVEYQSHALCNASFDLDESKYTHWKIRETLELKLKAILSTLPDSLSFEEVVKLVDEKLEFEQIINKQ